jgi:hypothetical protein
MRPGRGASCLGHDGSECRADHAADEVRLGRLLKQTDAARAARLVPADDALTKLNVALDALDMTPRRQTDHRRLFGACALVALLLLLLTPVARSEFAGSTQSAQQSVVTSKRGAVGGDAGTGIASGKDAVAPGTIAVSAGTNVAPTEGGQTAIHVAANGTAPMTETSETPLRDLLARAGIRASDPASGSSGEEQPPQR